MLKPPSAIICGLESGSEGRMEGGMAGLEGGSLVVWRVVVDRCVCRSSSREMSRVRWGNANVDLAGRSWNSWA